MPLRTLVRVAGQRWRVEESFQNGKGLTGLDEHQVRRWTSWHRWVTLAMLAHAFLTVITAAERATIDVSDLVMHFGVSLANIVGLRGGLVVLVVPVLAVPG